MFAWDIPSISNNSDWKFQKVVAIKFNGVTMLSAGTRPRL